jgi:hypothetical protein
MAWKEEMDIALHAAGVPEDRQTLWVLTAVSGLARQFVLTLDQPTQANWLLMRDALVNRFRPQNMNFFIRQKLHSLKQVGQAHDDYVREFQYLLGQLTDVVSEGEKVFYYCVGLPVTTQKEVLFTNPTTLTWRDPTKHRTTPPPAAVLRSRTAPTSGSTAATRPRWTWTRCLQHCKQSKHSER